MEQNTFGIVFSKIAQLDGQLFYYWFKLGRFQIVKAIFIGSKWKWGYLIGQCKIQLHFVEREQLILKLSIMHEDSLKSLLSNLPTLLLLAWFYDWTIGLLHNQEPFIGFRFEQTNPKIIEFESHLIDNITPLHSFYYYL